MYTNFAESVFNYFQNRMKETGQPLNETETQIFRQAERCRNAFPISCLTRDDLDKAGYDVSTFTDKQLQYLASKLGDCYHEELYWESLENLPLRYGFDRCDTCTLMKSEYEQWKKEEKTINGAVVLIQYKQSEGLEQVVIGVGKGKDKIVDCKFTVRDFDELCSLFDKNNRYGFYVKEFIHFI